MSKLGPQFQRLLKQLSDLYQTDHSAAEDINRAAAQSLQVLSFNPGTPQLLESITWPKES